MKTEKIESNLIVKLSFEFSLKMIKYCESLNKEKKFVISSQLLKSATSIGANIWEAQNAESKKDFIHKFKISAKEIDETQYWLLLCKYSDDNPNTDEYIDDLTTLNRIVNKIVTTSKKKVRSNN